MARAVLSVPPRLGSPPRSDSAPAGTLLDSVDLVRLRATRELDPRARGDLGQFLTPQPVARFMASMVRAPGETVRVLDAGAGVGSLAAALVAELLSRERRPRRIEATGYEIDAKLADGLRATLRLCEEASRAARVAFKGEVRGEDFIRSASELVEGGLLARPRRSYDCAILNPPYRKIRNDSVERKRLEAAGLETTNLYTAFLFLAAHLLAPGGELVAITPRSFCNGPYFKSFRKAFLKLMRLDRIHVFETRDTAFGEDEVLQENIILHAVRSDERGGSVLITSSASPGDPDIVQREAPRDEVVDPSDAESFLHILPDELSAAIARQVSSLGATLADLGIAVSTGRVVDFRAKDHLRKDAAPGCAPLIYPGHLTEGRVRWPREAFRKFNALVDCEETASLMVPSGPYTLVKRFSAKEEPRRIVASVIRAGDAPHPHWGFENHLNYFHHHGRPLPEDLARGLAAYLNTTLVDAYFRQFSGHTQVNATDLRIMPYPTRQELEAIAREIGDEVLDQEGLDLVVEECLGTGVRGGPSTGEGAQEDDEALAMLEQLSGGPRHRVRGWQASRVRDVLRP